MPAKLQTFSTTKIDGVHITLTDQEAKLVLILRTSNAQIGVQSATVGTELDGQIGSY